MGDGNPWLDRKPLHFAHQGGAREAPSNTLYAFKTAIPKGADALEMDLHMTADGEIVVIHDPTVDRTTNGGGLVDAMTLEEIKQLDAAHWWVPGYVTRQDAPDEDYVFRGVATGEKPLPEGFEANDFTIPTLREVLEAFPQVFINMEIKQTAPATKPYEDKVARILRDFGRGDDVIVAAFNDSALETFRTMAPEITTSAATGEALALWQWMKGEVPELPPIPYQALQLPPVWGEIKVLDDSLVEAAAKLDLALHVWTIDEEDDMEEYLSLGVHGLMTDRPSALQKVLARRK